jgi:hypothetical protein
VSVTLTKKHMSMYAVFLLPVQRGEGGAQRRMRGEANNDASGDNFDMNLGPRQPRLQMLDCSA